MAIELNPNDSKAYYNRGNTYNDLGNKNRACEDWQKACELGNCKEVNLAKKKGLCQ